MKVKMLVAVVSGLLAASLAYADVNPGAGAVGGGAGAGAVGEANAVNSEQDNSINGSDSMMNSSSQGTGNLMDTPANSGSDSGSLDQGTSDTATGDDDY